MFGLLVALLLASESAVDAILQMKRASPHRARSPTGTAFDEQQPIVNCTPPENFLQLVLSSRRGRPTVMMMSSSHAIYTADDGNEMSIFAYDCTTQTRLIFVHIPKNAGTTMEELGDLNGVSWGRFMLAGTQNIGGHECSRWHVPPSMLEGSNPYEDSEVFCITRDPWERMLSEYLYLLSKESAWGPYKHLHDGPSCTPEGLDAFVRNALADVEAGFAAYDYDCHLLPQWKYIEGPDGHQWCTHKLPIKDLTDTFNSLMVEHGIPLRLPPYEKRNSAKDFCPDLSAEADTNLEAFYSQPAKAIMRRVYAEDFAHLGDSFDDYDDDYGIKQ